MATAAMLQNRLQLLDRSSASGNTTAGRTEYILYVQVPNPLPLSWGRTVKPYEPLEMRQQPAAPEADAENVDSSNGQHVGTSYSEEEDVLYADFKQFKQPFQAVLINPGRADLNMIAVDLHPVRVSAHLSGLHLHARQRPLVVQTVKHRGHKAAQSLCILANNNRELHVEGELNDVTLHLGSAALIGITPSKCMLRLERCCSTRF